MKKTLIYGVFVAFCCVPYSLGNTTTADKGSLELTLQSTIDPAKTANPAQFPHGAHQARLECRTCHHSKSAEGKRLSYVEGQKIEKCETCHNSKSGLPEKISTFKNAAHTLCQGCHRKNRPELVKCSVCHKK